MEQPYLVTNIGTDLQPRLEIRDLEQKAIQFSLFVRALTQLQEMQSSDPRSPLYKNKPNSWWQMGAIHGLPFEPWSGDPKGQPQVAGSAYGGYCYHASVLFPTWHRVLLLLVEKALVEEAIAIANKVDRPSREIWVKEAQNLRLPFWDWTKMQTAEEGIPKIFQESYIEIINPDGSLDQAPNPLNYYAYASRPGSAEGVGYMGNWIRTFRWVDNGDTPKKEQYDKAQKAFSTETTLELYGKILKLRPVDWLREEVAGLFHYPLTLSDPSYGPNLWGYFSNTAALSDKVHLPASIPLLPSIEGSHNKVHLDTGGNGSMSVNEYAGFDPIFYLHHCNVDRIYAFWEYLYPNYWIGDGWKTEGGVTTPFQNDTDGNFQQKPNTAVDHTTPLIPFRKDVLSYWTSDDVHGLLPTSPTPKNYTYPAIKADVNGSTVEVKVDTPYTSNEDRKKYQQVLLKEWGQNLPDIMQTVETESERFSDDLRKALFFRDDKKTFMRRFVVIGELPEFAFPGLSYRLELLLLPKDPQNGTPQVVNNISVLTRAGVDKCAACKVRREAGSRVLGSIPLDPRIILHLLSRPSQHGDVPVPVTNLDMLSTLVKESFATRLVKADGTIIATPDSEVFGASRDGGVLDEAKAPALTLHSHIISIEYEDPSRTTDVPIVKLRRDVDHGIFRHKKQWQIIWFVYFIVATTLCSNLITLKYRNQMSRSTRAFHLVYGTIYDFLISRFCSAKKVK